MRGGTTEINRNMVAERHLGFPKARERVASIAVPPFEKSARTRVRILDAAARVFSLRGYAATRLSDIASEAELRQGSIYYYFASKDELVEEMLRTGLEKTYAHVSDAMEAAGPDASAGDRLRTAIRAHAEAVIDALDYTAANARIVGQLPDEVRQQHYRDQQPYGRLWSTLLTEARDAGDIRADLDLTLVRLLILGALNWTVEWPPRAKRTTSSVADTLAAIVFEGVQPKGRRKSTSADVAQRSRNSGLSVVAR
jgi:AcrR family transcriptional regulator